MLVVDDNPHIVSLIIDGLSRRGRRAFKERISFEFETAENGQLALEALSEWCFDVIITDVHLPVLDGYHLMSKIRESEEHRLTPILAVSAERETTEDQAKSAGADLFLNKPLRLRGLLEQMGAALDLAEQRQSKST